jgi:hypothetical protein
MVVHPADAIIRDPDSGLSIPRSMSEPYTFQMSMAKRQAAWHADELDNTSAAVRIPARAAKYRDVTKRAVRQMGMAKTVRDYHSSKKTPVGAPVL